MIRCPVPNHGNGDGDPKPSLKIADRSADDGITVHCFAGCSWQGVKDALRRDGLLPEWEPGRDNPKDPAELEAARARHQAERKIKEQRETATAQSMWQEAALLTAECPAGQYLTGRALPGPWPGSLRFLPSIRHPSGAMVPAMIVAMCKWPDRQLSAVQMTALTAEGRKVDFEPVRWTRGTPSGAALRVASWDEHKEILLVEGVEDGLSVLKDMPGSTPWAALGVSNVANILLPEGAKVILILDGDVAGKRSAREAAAVFKARGYLVRITDLPDGMDPNSMLSLRKGRTA